MIITCTLSFAFSSLSVSATSYNLPNNEDNYQPVKDYFEEAPVMEYRYPSLETIEIFRGIKYVVSIHWGLYSILGQERES